jgi:hypothetical protein
MTPTDPHGIALQAEELAALVMGREPPETVERLRGLADGVRRGGLPGHADLSLFERIRVRYGHELAELTRSEP